jgi:hypothetical protein
MGDMASTATATAVPPPPSTSPRQQLAALESLELSSRADSGHSLLSQGSASGSSEQQQMRGASAELDAAADAGAAATAFAGLAGSQGSGPSGVQGPGGAAAAAAAAASAAAAPPVKKEDARSSALKALAGVSAIVSKSRKVDAEALQAIKSQRAKARAEGLTPGTATPAGGTGRVTPPPGTVASVAAVGAQEGPGISPFASATSQGLARSPSSNNMGSLASGLGHATSLPISMHSMQRTRRSPASTPPASSADYDAMVSKMTITELVALKQAVESQLAKQAMALAQLHASQQQVPATTDMLSQQYAALLLQNAQQAQLVQQLSSQQQAAHAVAIQQALSAAATAAGITSPTFSPEQLLLGQAAQQSVAASTAALGQYASMPLPDMASPFASAAYPPESGFTLPPEAGARGPVGVAAAAGLVTGRNKSGGSPRSASAEQHLIGEALHSFVVSSLICRGCCFCACPVACQSFMCPGWGGAALVYGEYEAADLQRVLIGQQSACACLPPAYPCRCSGPLHCLPNLPTLPDLLTSACHPFCCRTPSGKAPPAAKAPPSSTASTGATGARAARCRPSPPRLRAPARCRTRKTRCTPTAPPRSARTCQATAVSSSYPPFLEGCQCRARAAGCRWRCRCRATPRTRTATARRPSRPQCTAT